MALLCLLVDLSSAQEVEEPESIVLDEESLAVFEDIAEAEVYNDRYLWEHGGIIREEPDPSTIVTDEDKAYEAILTLPPIFQDIALAEIYAPDPELIRRIVGKIAQANLPRITVSFEIPLAKLPFIVYNYTDHDNRIVYFNKSEPPFGSTGVTGILWNLNARFQMNYLLAKGGIQLADRAFPEEWVIEEAKAEEQGLERNEYRSTRLYLELGAPINLSNRIYLGPVIGWNYRDIENHFVYQSEEGSGINDIDHHFSESGHGYQLGVVFGFYTEPLTSETKGSMDNLSIQENTLSEIGVTLLRFGERWEQAIRYTFGAYSKESFHMLWYSEYTFTEFGNRFHYGIRIGFTF